MEKSNNELLEKLMKMQWLMKQHRMQAKGGNGPFADTSRGQGRVLALLKLQPEISTGDLSYLLGIRQQSLNELLNKLEKAEYIKRTQLESDKRVIMVKITEKGKAEPQEGVEFDNVFNCLTEEEQADLGALLDKVIANLEEGLGDDFSEKMAKWENAARKRMGDENFEEIMSRRGDFRHCGHSRKDFQRAFVNRGRECRGGHMEAQGRHGGMF